MKRCVTRHATLITAAKEANRKVAFLLFGHAKDEIRALHFAFFLAVLILSSHNCNASEKVPFHVT